MSVLVSIRFGSWCAVVRDAAKGGISEPLKTRKLVDHWDSVRSSARPQQKIQSLAAYQLADPGGMSSVCSKDAPGLSRRYRAPAVETFLVSQNRSYTL